MGCPLRNPPIRLAWKDIQYLEKTQGSHGQYGPSSVFMYYRFDYWTPPYCSVTLAAQALSRHKDITSLHISSDNSLFFFES
jgi:hypothetical protein